ncbi:MAG: hypothetical protein U0L09_03990 [Christensenellales bacterium]|nr:hypothetical protein [Christensenellales bacterium]
MVIDENWAVPPETLRAYFLAQPDVLPKGAGFQYYGCTITLTPVEDHVMGKWLLHRTQVRMEGDKDSVTTIHRRFFLRFLSAGG